ncbi:integrase family protein [Sporocytophaga myxococcoides]|uniref:Integrase family protein n=1 Tax=Sporocytophaga myxococcoides TaxID=153721 RepID=A0A098LFN2_9BACT|nr:tyrosine-type recombinase/integrase [Sporocytophaga myxococcoides]GAL85771.1 integrase family protein [Sporocytophaga myxococcoides]
MKTLEEYLKSRYTAKTAQSYKREIEIYQGNNPAADKARYQDIVNYIGSLRTRYRNPQTLSRILSSIKAYYDFLSSTGKRKDNPGKAIRLRDKQSKDIQLQDLFTTEELEQLLNRKERYNALEYRNKVLMSLLIYQALKPEEITQFRADEINLSRATVYIRGSGKNNSRELTLKPTQIILFHHYQTEIRPKLLKGTQSDIFIIGHRGGPMKGENITKHVKRSFRMHYNPRKVNCQTIRQSVITNLLSAGNDLRIVQVFAGHKYPSTTEKYKQTNVEALKSAIQSYHPIR